MMIRNAGLTSDTLYTVAFQLITTSHNRTYHASGQQITLNRLDLLTKIGSLVSSKKLIVDNINSVLDKICSHELRQSVRSTVQDAAAILFQVSITGHTSVARNYRLGKRSLNDRKRKRIIQGMRAKRICLICHKLEH